MKNTGCFACPSDKQYGWNGSASATTSTGYAMFNAMSGRALATITQPASCVMLADCGQLPPPTWTSQRYYLCDWNYNVAVDNGPVPWPFHSDGANLAFCDGHVKWFHKTKYGNHDPAGGPAPDPTMWTP